MGEHVGVSRLKAPQIPTPRAAPPLRTPRRGIPSRYISHFICSSATKSQSRGGVRLGNVVELPQQHLGHSFSAFSEIGEGRYQVATQSLRAIKLVKAV